MRGSELNNLNASDDHTKGRHLTTCTYKKAVLGRISLRPTPSNRGIRNGEGAEGDSRGSFHPPLFPQRFSFLFIYLFIFPLSFNISFLFAKCGWNSLVPQNDKTAGPQILTRMFSGVHFLLVGGLQQTLKSRDMKTIPLQFKLVPYSLSSQGTK